MKILVAVFFLKILLYERTREDILDEQITNGVPQGTIIESLLFNLYDSDWFRLKTTT